MKALWEKRDTLPEEARLDLWGNAEVADDFPILLEIKGNQIPKSYFEKSIERIKENFEEKSDFHNKIIEETELLFSDEYINIQEWNYFCHRIMFLHDATLTHNTVDGNEYDDQKSQILLQSSEQPPKASSIVFLSFEEMKKVRSQHPKFYQDIRDSDGTQSRKPLMMILAKKPYFGKIPLLLSYLNIVHGQCGVPLIPQIHSHGKKVSAREFKNHDNAHYDLWQRSWRQLKGGDILRNPFESIALEIIQRLTDKDIRKLWGGINILFTCIHENINPLKGFENLTGNMSFHVRFGFLSMLFHERLNYNKKYAKMHDEFYQSEMQSYNALGHKIPAPRQPGFSDQLFHAFFTELSELNQSMS